jgi:hypothetical protein
MRNSYTDKEEARMRYWLTFGIIILILMATFNWVEFSITKGTTEETFATPYNSLATMKFERTTISLELRAIPVHRQLLRNWE